MSDMRELSRLPNDPEYWAALEARIVTGLPPRVESVSRAQDGWLEPLAARAWGLGVLAAAAVVATLLLVPRRTTDASAGLLRLPQEDATFAAFVSAPAPPSLGSLVLPPVRGDENE
jgi:hypothetical protein